MTNDSLSLSLYVTLTYTHTHTHTHTHKHTQTDTLSDALQLTNDQQKYTRGQLGADQSANQCFTVVFHLNEPTALNTAMSIAPMPLKHYSCFVANVVLWPRRFSLFQFESERDKDREIY